MSELEVAADGVPDRETITQSHLMEAVETNATAWVEYVEATRCHQNRMKKYREHMNEPKTALAEQLVLKDEVCKAFNIVMRLRHVD